MVSAASCGTSSPPGTVKLDGFPVAQVIITQSIRGQITNLQLGELPQKLTERHPGDKGNSSFMLWVYTIRFSSINVSNTNVLKIHSPWGHPVYRNEFVYSSKLAHQWIFCYEWVPSELEADEHITTVDKHITIIHTTPVHQLTVAYF